MIAWILLIVLGFFSGAIMFSYYLPKALYKVDIRKGSMDQNPGSVNVFLQYGWKLGLVSLFLDMLKGFWPVLIACLTLDVYSPMLALVMVAPVLGHALAPFQKVSGGKCIATSFGVVCATFTISYVGWLLPILYILFSTVIRIKPMERRSILVFFLFAITGIILSFMEGYYSLGVGYFLLSVVAIFKHLIRIKVRV